ncbi:sodium:solute symporter [bacterium]|nr:sodium:solute symporter [bacterium]
MKVSFIDLGIIAIYLLGTVAFGFLFLKKSKSSEGFTAANRSLPGWACGMSILATYVSSISFLAIPGNAMGTNWNAYVFSLSLPIATLLAVKFFVPLYRSRNEVSAYSYLEARFGTWARIYASSCYLLTQIARMGTVMYLMALPVSELLGINIIWIIIITGIAVSVYTLVGGLEAVVWNDTIQGFLLAIGALACLGILMFGMPEGPGQVFRIGAENHKFSLGSFGLDLTKSTFWVVMIYGVFINLQNFGIDQSYIQRFISAKSDKEATLSTWMGGLLYIPVSALFFLIGTALFAYYKVQPDLIPAEYLQPGNSDKVFPYFIVNGLPTGATGLLIAAIFAAAMSTVSTSVNSAATVVYSDFYKRLIRPNATEKQSMMVLYGTTIVLGILGILLALAMINVKSALDVWWKLAGIFSGGMLGLFLLGYFSRFTRNTEAVIGVVAGVLVITWMSLSSWKPELLGGLASPLHSYMTIVFGTSTIVLVGFLLTLAFGRKNAAGTQA